MKIPSFQEYFTSTWDQVEPLYQSLMERELKEETLDDWMSDWSELRKLVDERNARLSLATDLDTTDEDAEKTFHHFLEEFYSSAQSADQKLKEKLLESGLEPAGMELALKKMRVEADTFREENLPLSTQESKLGTEYNKISGAQSIEWEGEELTLVQVKTALLTTDRDKRQNLWQLLAQRQLEDRDAINDLWIQFMKLRADQASNADFPDYRSFSWQKRLRLDYSPAESKQFIQAVKDVAVPAATRVYERYKTRLGIDQVRPWDLLNNQTTFSLPALEVFETEEEFTAKVGAILNQVDPVLGGYFNSMVKGELLDLMNRKGKAPGGFCTSFATEGVPFIFMNSSGKSSDLRVLFHEAGHAFHVYERVNLDYHHQWRAGMEFNEVASTAMELLAEPYLAEDQGGFMSTRDAALARLLNLEEKLLFWPYMAVVVAFQHWVYENHDQGSNPAACDSKWAELIDEYMPGINWNGFDEIKMTGWHRKLHIHLVPFYYIEYGLSSLGAFQIWEKARQDSVQAVVNYRKALALGGTASLPELYEISGAKLAFDKDTLGSVVELIESTMADLEGQLK